MSLINCFLYFCLLLQDELIAKLGQLGVSGLQTDSTKIVFSEQDIVSVCGAEGLEQACDMGIVCKKGNSYQFYHKSAQEHSASIWLALNQDILSEYLENISTVRDALSLNMVLRFTASNIESAEKIVKKLTSIFLSDKQCQQYYNETGEWPFKRPLLSFDESLTVQQFIELCLECNYEANAESRFTDTLGKLFEVPASEREKLRREKVPFHDDITNDDAYGAGYCDGQRVMLYGVTAKTAITLGYYMKHSGSKITRLDLTPSAHVTDYAKPWSGPARELCDKTRKSLLQLDTRQLEDICDKFIASHPDMNEAWKRNRTRCVGEIERAKSEEDKEEWQGHHRRELAELAAYIACIQHAPNMPSVSETDLSPVIQSLPYIDIRKLDLTRGYYGMMRSDVITRLASVLGKCASLRVLDAGDTLFTGGLSHWDIQQRRALCQAISGMTNLTELDLSFNELDRDCQQHLVTSLKELSQQGTASLKKLDLERTRLDKDMLYGVLDACNAMGSVKKVW